MPDITQLETFVLTSELRSLAAVARKLGISPAAVSKQLTRLEEELGLQLLIRTTRKIELTEVGINYCYQCRRILDEMETASALISQHKAIPAGSLKIVSGRHFAITYILPYVNEFLNKYPKIELNLELAERIPDLNLEPIDVQIGMSIPATGDAIQKKITVTRYVFCASPEYLKQFGDPLSPDDLIKHRYITHSMRQPDDQLIFSNKKIVQVNPYLRVNDTEAMLKFALDGMGIVMLHHYVVREHLNKGGLVELMKSFARPEVPIYAAYPQRRYVSSKVRCFIDFVIDKIHKSN